MNWCMSLDCRDSSGKITVATEMPKTPSGNSYRRVAQLTVAFEPCGSGNGTPMIVGPIEVG